MKLGDNEIGMGHFIYHILLLLASWCHFYQIKFYGFWYVHCTHSATLAMEDEKNVDNVTIIKFSLKKKNENKETE